MDGYSQYFKLLLTIDQLLRDIIIRRQKFKRVDLRQNLIMNDLVFLVSHRIHQLTNREF